MKRIWISLVAAGLLTVAMFAPATGQSIFSVPLDEADDSGIHGGASIRGVDGQVEVTVFISEGDTDGVHPVHIHDGTCDDLGGVAYPLEDIVDGESVTTLEDLELADIMTGEYAINAHMSEDDMGTHVMCGNIPAVEGLAPADDDDAVEEDDEVVEEDDEVVEEDDEVVEEEDDAVVDDEEADDAEEMVPAAGNTGGLGPEAMVLMMTLAGGAALGTGLLVRRRLVHAS